MANASLVAKPGLPLGFYNNLVQPKLEINAPDDRYEQEADTMANNVMRMSSTNATVKPLTGLIGRSVQRKCTKCEEEEKKKLMRKTEGSGHGAKASPSLASSINATHGGGAALPPATRSFMESAFNANFAGVHIHTDSKASEMSRGINAKAFTTGSDIYFKHGAYNPNTAEGKHLLAHELTHVVQQGNAAINKGETIQRQGDQMEQQSGGTCYTCQIPGGLGICCPSSDMPLVPECWDMATKIIDKCPGAPTSCVQQAKCAQCQCVAAKMGSRYCQCTGMV